MDLHIEMFFTNVARRNVYASELPNSFFRLDS